MNSPFEFLGFLRWAFAGDLYQHLKVRKLMTTAECHLYDPEKCPEMVWFIPAVYEAISRTLALNPLDMKDMTLQLATAVYYSSLRMHPDALRVVGETGGPEAEFRAMEYLSKVGFPRCAPRTPKDTTKAFAGNRRMTPDSVRALWPMALDAVKATMELGPDKGRGLVLSLSWGLHRQSMLTFKWYREQIYATDGSTGELYEYLKSSYRIVRKAQENQVRGA